MKGDIFYKVPKNLVRAKGYISPLTGVAVKLTSTEKLVYIYILDRINFFVRRKNGEYFESQHTIAEGCGLEYKAVGRAIRGFIENGVLHAKKGKEAGAPRHRYYYTGVEKSLILWIGTESDPKMLIDREDSGNVLEKEY